MAYTRPPNTLFAGTALTQTPTPLPLSPAGLLPTILSANIATTASMGVVQIGDNINVTPSGVISVAAPIPGPPGPAFPGYYGSFFDTTTQTNPVINTANAFQLNSVVAASGVSVVSGSQITVANAGVYDIQFSAQFSKLTGANHDADIWLALNGTNVPSSNTQITLFGSNSKSVPSWNFVLPLAAGDYVELLWSSSEASMLILAQPPQIDPVRPEIPSVIVTVALIKEL